MSATADRPVTPRRQATRDRLVEAAAAVFAAKGFGAATVDNICAEAGFTRGAFYSNFDSLTEVFVELYERRTAEVVGQIRGAAQEIGELTPSSVARLVSAVVGRLPDDRRWRVVQAEFTAHALRDPAAARALAAPRAALATAIRPLLGAGTSPRAADDLARVLLALHDGLAVQQQLEPGARIAPLREGALQAVARAAFGDGLRPVSRRPAR